MRCRPAALLAPLLALVWLVALPGCGGGGGGTSQDSVVESVSIGDASPEPSAAPPPEPGREPAPEPQPEPEITGTGRLVSVTPLAQVGTQEIAQALLAPDLQAPAAQPIYDVANFRIVYRTVDGFGRELDASGLVSVPLKPAGAASPLVSYQHGTIFYDAEAPSSRADAREPAVVLASLGYLVVAADYVGYGVSKGVEHPYLLAEPSAAAVLDLLTAARTWRRQQGLRDNGQLFLVGYSEGGYVTMAAHRAMQSRPSPHLAQLLVSVPGAGPYHVGVTMDELLRRVRDENPVIGALLSPGLLKNLGASVRKELRRLLLRQLIPEDADVSFQSNFIDHYMADDSAALERESNVHDWRPDAPVAMTHGRDDQTVPYAASVVTLQAMQARGAPQVSLTDCPAMPSTHRGCVAPYWTFMLQQLAPLAQGL